MHDQGPGRLSRRALDPAFELAAAQVAAGTVPFVILGVADRVGTIRLESFGMTVGPRIGIDALCLLASITKPIVATAVMHEVEAGRLDLDQPLVGLLPELATAGAGSFTAWHVLTHTSGIGDVYVEGLLLEGGDRAELLRRAIALPQRSVPGSAFDYATAPFDILAEGIARRVGRPFEAVLREDVLDPLGMTETVFAPGPDAAPRMAPVAVDLPALAGIPGSALIAGFTGLRLAGGGLWSTAGDVLRFGRAMLRGGELDGRRVLSPAFVDLMTREVTVGGLGAADDVQRAEHYAIGWGKPGVSSPASASSFGHGGGSGTRLWVDPAHDLVFLYLTGSWAMSHEPINAVQHAVYAALP
ncbi:MAG TPA: serine hydrolase [Candidatus Limnocylindrales bacterium]